MLVTKTVYSLYYPQTRRIVDALWAERPHHLYEQSYTKRQDAMHGPMLSRWRAWLGQAGVSLGDHFPHEYPIAGASEGIQALMGHLAASAGPMRPRIHVFDGEYEGFGFVAAAAGVQAVSHPRDVDRYPSSITGAARPGDCFFLSQPSAIDGGVWPELPRFLAWMASELPAVSVVVDLTYVGAVAKDYAFDLASPNVTAVLASLSKPFGVYYHRVGAIFSRVALPGLHGNLWFKNLFSIALGERLLSAYGPRDLPRLHLDVQRAALDRAKNAGVVPAEAIPCDVVLLASAHPPTPTGELGEFTRTREGGAAILRFCLTPAMDALLSERGVE